jgi:hypothetical protein
MGSSRFWLLHEAARFSVANSTASKERQGPRRWISSGLERMLTLSARAFDVDGGAQMWRGASGETGAVRPSSGDAREVFKILGLYDLKACAQIQS